MCIVQTLISHCLILNITLWSMKQLTLPGKACHDKSNDDQKLHFRTSSFAPACHRSTDRHLGETFPQFGHPWNLRTGVLQRKVRVSTLLPTFPFVIVCLSGLTYFWLSKGEKLTWRSCWNIFHLLSLHGYPSPQAIWSWSSSNQNQAFGETPITFHWATVPNVNPCKWMKSSSMKAT